MANSEHVEVVKQGAGAIEEWREENRDVRLQLDHANLSYVDLALVDLGGAELKAANLGGADLNGAYLSGTNLARASLGGANLSGANLEGADLTDTDLADADLFGAKLSGANLSGADLSGANFFRADLSGANLSSVDLSGTNLHHADVRGADVGGAVVASTILADIDLSSVQALESVSHHAPSTIGIDTLYKSKGQIPESFLRGCGVPDGLIEYLPSLLGMQEAIQFYSCFISYSHRDEEFCQRLHSRMRDEHLRVWFAPEDMKAGRKIHEQIDHAIRVHDKLLIVLSEASMESEWVETEIHHALQRERREGRRVLFPIRLASLERIKQWKAFDADTGKDMAREVREYHLPDFSNWKEHDAFEQAFKSLLADLRASE